MAGALATGLNVPGRFGTEVVARLLGLRINHPAAQDYLELRPQDTATRAEAAYSAAQILSFGPLADSWQIAQVKASPPRSRSRRSTRGRSRSSRRRVLEDRDAVRLGRNERHHRDRIRRHGPRRLRLLRLRLARLQAPELSQRGDLASVIQGRTTYQMSVEVPNSKRIPSRSSSRPTSSSSAPRAALVGIQIIHTGIYVGNGWFIQSSDEGVALAQLTGWYKQNSRGVAGRSARPGSSTE